MKAAQSVEAPSAVQEPREAEVVVLVRYTMPDGRSYLQKLAKARKAGKLGAKKTESARAAKAEKLAKRDAAKRSANVSTVRDAMKWFMAARDRYMPDMGSIGSWTAKEKGQVKRLLTEYGADETRDVIFFFFEHFEGYVESSNGRVGGAPNPSLMYAMRKRVFMDMRLNRVPGIQRNTERLTKDEYDEQKYSQAEDPFWG